MNFRALSEELMNQEVEITLKAGSEPYRRFGRSLTGILSGRLVEERFEHGQLRSTVIAITLQTFQEYLSLPVVHIENLTRATYLA